MTQFLAALVLIILAVAGMSIGVLIGKTRVRGSCGGLANLRDASGRTACDACTTPSPDCTAGPADRDDARQFSTHSASSAPHADG